MLAQLIDDHAHAVAQVLQGAAEPTQARGAPDLADCRTIKHRSWQMPSIAVQVEAKLAAVWLEYGLSGTSHPASHLAKALRQAVQPAEARHQLFYRLCFPTLCQALLDGEPQDPLRCAAASALSWHSCMPGRAGALDMPQLQQSCPTLDAMLAEAPADCLLLVLHR